ncbi:MAG: N-acetylneuraminate synthase family protein [Pseudomonadota bacterium]|nr:N-acetylneuraminate synthase family protein [Pseudomonadota bacterium]
MQIIVDLFNQHSGDLDELERMALSAKLAGADFVKIQLLDSQAIWGDDSRKYLEMTRDQFLFFKEYCDKQKIKMFATSFTFENHEWLRESEIEMYKLASVTVQKEPEFCEAVIAEGKPTFVSNGFTPEKTLFSDRENVIRFFCVSKYPTLLNDEDLKFFPEAFGKNQIFQGFSDHTPGYAAALVAKVRGAEFLEKHFTPSINLQRPGELGHMAAFDSDSLARFRGLTKELDIFLDALG